MNIIDGKEVASIKKEEIKQAVTEMVSRGQRPPCLAAIIVGNDGASETYVAHKVKACEQVGFRSVLIRFDEGTAEEELLKRINDINQDQEIDGLIVQLPLPSHISEEKVIQSVDFRKDVDGFHPVNMGRMLIGLPSYVSATPFGIVELIRHYQIETRGKHCVVLGRSNIVGKPIGVLLSRKGCPGDATVTVCHSRTNHLREFTLSADILIVALGQPGFVSADMVREGAVVIDVGITRVKSETTKSGYTLKGDVDFEKVAPKCTLITPVPGGVGPMTIVSLLHNTLLAARKDIYPDV
jgi:methylenetetrahydrofolate dehydrogenase (NADP+) / methenyltetrahydrofolate cyclohydrolase